MLRCGGTGAGTGTAALQATGAPFGCPDASVSYQRPRPSVPEHHLRQPPAADSGRYARRSGRRLGSGGLLSGEVPLGRPKPRRRLPCLRVPRQLLPAVSAAVPSSTAGRWRAAQRRGSISTSVGSRGSMAIGTGCRVRRCAA